jgi:hypothetical protein
LEVLFPEKKVKRILEVLFLEKTSALIADERSSVGPILPFFIFIFPGIVRSFSSEASKHLQGRKATVARH